MAEKKKIDIEAFLRETYALAKRPDLTDSQRQQITRGHLLQMTADNLGNQAGFIPSIDTRELADIPLSNQKEINLQNFGSYFLRFMQCIPHHEDKEDREWERKDLQALTERKKELSQLFNEVWRFLEPITDEWFTHLLLRPWQFETEEELMEYGPKLQKWLKGQLILKGRHDAFEQITLFSKKDRYSPNQEIMRSIWSQKRDNLEKFFNYFFGLAMLSRQEKDHFQKMMKLFHRIHEEHSRSRINIQFDLDGFPEQTKRVIDNNLSGITQSLLSEHVKFSFTALPSNVSPLIGVQVGETSFGQERDLRALALFQVDVARLNLSRVILDGANLEDSLLTTTNFTDAFLAHANLRYTKKRVPMYDIDSEGMGEQREEGWDAFVDFSRADCTGMDISNRNLAETSFKDAILRDALMLDMKFKKVNFSGADLTGAHISRREDLTEEAEQLIIVSKKTKMPSGDFCSKDGQFTFDEVFGNG